MVEPEFPRHGAVIRVDGTVEKLFATDGSDTQILSVVPEGDVLESGLTGGDLFTAEGQEMASQIIRAEGRPITAGSTAVFRHGYGKINWGRAKE